MISWRTDTNDVIEKLWTFLTRLVSALQFVCICCSELLIVEISTRELLPSMPATPGLVQPQKLGQGVGTISNIYFSIQTAPYMECWKASSIKGHALRTALRPQIGSRMQHLSVLEDGMLSSFFSFIPTECCMEFKREDFTRGTHPHFPLTIGLARQNWSDREAGPFSNSSSSTHRESCTAS